MTLSIVRLYVRYASARDVVLVVELISVCACPVFLVLMVRLAVVLVARVMLERLTQVHGHVESLVIVAPVHHDVMGLIAMAMALVVHAELLGRLRAGRTRGRRGVWVVEGDASASCG